MSINVGRWLCGFGIHRWRQFAMSIFGDPAYLCIRPHCRSCRQYFLHAGEYIYWEREESLEETVSQPNPNPVEGECEMDRDKEVIWLKAWLKKELKRSWVPWLKPIIAMHRRCLSELEASHEPK